MTQKMLKIINFVQAGPSLTLMILKTSLKIRLHLIISIQKHGSMGMKNGVI